MIERQKHNKSLIIFVNHATIWAEICGASYPASTRVESLRWWTNLSGTVKRTVVKLIGILLLRFRPWNWPARRKLMMTAADRSIVLRLIFIAFLASSSSSYATTWKLFTLADVFLTFALSPGGRWAKKPSNEPCRAIGQRTQQCSIVLLCVNVL